jgi:hypothetical protein
MGLDSYSLGALHVCMSLCSGDRYHVLLFVLSRACMQGMNQDNNTAQEVHLRTNYARDNITNDVLLVSSGDEQVFCNIRTSLTMLTETGMAIGSWQMNQCDSCDNCDPDQNVASYFATYRLLDGALSCGVFGMCSLSDQGAFPRSVVLMACWAGAWISMVCLGWKWTGCACQPSVLGLHSFKWLYHLMSYHVISCHLLSSHLINTLVIASTTACEEACRPEAVAGWACSPDCEYRTETAGNCIAPDVSSSIPLVS